MNDKIVLISRIFMGLVFVVFGFNGFFNFIAMPPLPEAAGSFMGALAATGYFFPVLKITEIVTGAMILFKFQQPLALIIISPVIVQIVLFHGFLAPAGLLIPIPLLLAHLILVCDNMGKFKSLLDD